MGEGGAADGPLGGKRAGPTGENNISFLGEKTTSVDFNIDQSRELSMERLVRMGKAQSRQSAKRFSSRWNWDSPTPLAAGECAPPPYGTGGGHTRLRLKGWGSPNSNEGTYTVVLYMYNCIYISTLWGKGSFYFDLPVCMFIILGDTLFFFLWGEGGVIKFFTKEISKSFMMLLLAASATCSTVWAISSARFFICSYSTIADNTNRIGMYSNKLSQKILK